MPRLVAFALLAWMTAPAAAQPPTPAPPDPVIDFMTGRWARHGHDSRPAGAGRARLDTRARTAASLD